MIWLHKPLKWEHSNTIINKTGCGLRTDKKKMPSAGFESQTLGEANSDGDYYSMLLPNWYLTRYSNKLQIYTKGMAT